MRRFIATSLLVLVPLLAAYIAWPLHTALQIRDAIVAGDTATLARKIAWDELRESLRTSLSEETISRLAAAPDAPKPTVWQRIKALVAPSVADRVIERYVTPEHLPVLLGYRRVYRGSVRPALGLKEPATALAGTWFDGGRIDRFVSFWSRVRRAVFVTPGTFVLEVEDKYKPDRRYVGTFELRGFEWKLIALSVNGDGF